MTRKVARSTNLDSNLQQRCLKAPSKNNEGLAALLLQRRGQGEQWVWRRVHDVNSGCQYGWLLLDCTSHSQWQKSRRISGYVHSVVTGSHPSGFIKDTSQAQDLTPETSIWYDYLLITVCTYTPYVQCRISINYICNYNCMQTQKYAEFDVKNILVRWFNNS